MRCVRRTFAALFALWFAVAVIGCGQDPANGSKAGADGSDTDVVGKDAVEAGDASPAVDTDSSDGADAPAPDPDGADTSEPDTRSSEDTDTDGLDSETSESLDADADASVDTGPPELDVEAINPNHGPLEGGTEISIRGQGFTDSTKVFVDGIEIETEISGGNLVGETPSVSAPGWVAVKVLDPSTGKITIPDGFRYTSKLTISKVEPSRASTNGKTRVTIHGAGFDEQTRFSFGDKSGLDHVFVDSSKMRVLVPSHDAGKVNVRATNRLASTRLKDGFEYFVPLQIRRIKPAGGPVEGGNIIEIRGRGFTPEMSVFFGGNKGILETVVDSKTLQVQVPAHAEGLVDVRVTAPRKGTNLLEDAYLYGAEANSMSIRAVYPDHGTTEGGTEVMVVGAGLGEADVSIEFDGKPAQNVVERGVGYALVETPPHVEGRVPVTVSNSNGSDSLGGAFTYEAPLRIDSAAPYELDTSGGEQITVRGTGFQGLDRVVVGDRVASSFSVPDDSTLEVSAPAHPPGSVDIEVERGEATSTQTDAVRYTTPFELYGYSPGRGSIAGNTYVTFRGNGVDSDLSVSFGGVEAKDFEVLDSRTFAVRTPSHGPGDVDVEIDNDGQTIEVDKPFTYFNPGSRSGGAWGGPIRGAVNVSVYSRGGRPIEGAFVMLSTDSETAYKGQTDSNGMITLSGPDVYGEQTITATAAGFSSGSVQHVDAQNITIFLTPDPQQGPPGPGPPTATFRGELTGLDKLIEPRPNERLMAMVRTTQKDPFSNNPDPGSGNIVFSDGTYELKSRIGDLALVALGGVMNTVTNEFTPLKMGLKRYQFASEGETYNVDIDLDTWTNKTLTFKLPQAPRHPEGPDINRVVPYLDFGFEGVFGGVDVAIGESNLIQAEHQVALEGKLSDASYTMIGGAYTGAQQAGAPMSVAFKRDVTAIDSVIEMPPLPAIARVKTPESGQAPTDGLVKFTTQSVNRPDFYYVRVQTFRRVTKWDGFFPGNINSFRFPDFPDFSDLPADQRPEPYPGSQLVLTIIGVEKPSFNYNQVSYSDLTQTSWDAYSVWSQVVQLPGDEQFN